MARVTHVKKAQQRYKTVPVIDPATGEQKVTPVLRKDGTPKMTRSKPNRPGRPIVMKVTVADKTQPLPPLKCEKCGKDIEIGTPYKHVSPKSGPYGGRQRNRHAACPGWKPSELTSSQHLSTIYAAQEAAEEALSAWGDEDGHEALQEIITTLAEGFREASESYGESADNIEEGFGHETSMSAELREKAEALESSADEVEQAADDIDEFDEDAAREEAEDEVEALDEEMITEAAIRGIDDVGEHGAAIEAAMTEAREAREQEVEQAFEEKRTTWADEQRTKAEEAIGTDSGV